MKLSTDTNDDRASRDGHHRSLLPHTHAGRRIMVFVQPGVEIVLVPSPSIGKPEEFNHSGVEPLGIVTMNTKHALWFTPADGGERIHLAKAPAHNKPESKKKKSK